MSELKAPLWSADTPESSLAVCVAAMDVAIRVPTAWVGPFFQSARCSELARMNCPDLGSDHVHDPHIFVLTTFK